MLSVAVNHTWEAGHRLPHIEGKCQSLHGHSWYVEAEVAVDDPVFDGVLIEFATIKRILREWIDSRLDHGLMLGQADTLVGTLSGEGKVFVFGYDTHSGGLDWPTVENVATLIARMIEFELRDVTVLRVTVRETPTNEATWRKDAPCRA
ncbi:QueD-like queosine biosynthesis protein [Microbacterium phage Megan]|uniref:QueD-like queosine biosynthesis protein n=1 Tax=Microbacterium phage Megan TaxID=2656551 RepID=A0A649VK39_9CAUD|nr:QueD-like queosine biosynthesis protein [Microbacterium phage Megan]QGJ92678.1 QueD-like queosine biosynthesis protein [Microbacterium phage Megan]